MAENNIDISKLQEVLFSDLKNPFSTDYWENLNINITRSGIVAVVDFRNDKTYGSHEIEATDIDDLNEKLKDFFAAMKAAKI